MLKKLSSGDGIFFDIGDDTSVSLVDEVSLFGDDFVTFFKILVKFIQIINSFEKKHTPLKSANPLIPKVSAKANRLEICSSYTFTSPEYINVSN